MYPPSFADIPSVTGFVKAKSLDQFPIAIGRESEQQLYSDFDHIVMCTMDWLQTLTTREQKAFMNDFMQGCLICGSYEHYVTNMMAAFAELGISKISQCSRKDMKQIDDSNKQADCKEDLLYTEKAQDLLKKLREDCPDLPEYVRQGVARMWAAGCIPEGRPSKPLTGAERRRLKKFMPIEHGSLPKPCVKPVTDFYGNITVTDKPLDMPMIAEA